MSIFKIPRNIIQIIEAVTRKFWWANGTEDEKLCWLSWKKLTRPKNQGGLGLTDPKIFNRAMLAKLAWRFLKNGSSLWVRVLRGLYYNNEDVLNQKAKPSDSWAWRSLLEGVSTLKDVLRWKVGDGQ